MDASNDSSNKVSKDMIPVVTRADVQALLSIMHIRLGENNFLKWSFQLQSFLTDLFGFFDGSIVAPPRFVVTESGGITPVESDEYRQWKKFGMALLGLLMGSLDEDTVDIIIGCKTSRQAWLALEERFSAVSRVNIMQLKIELQNIRKGAEPIEKYLQRVKNARDQLMSVGVSVPEEDVIIVIFNGLPEEYSTARAIIEGRENPISLRDLRSQLLAAERRVEGSISFNSSMTALAAKNGGTNRPWNARSTQRRGGDGRMSHSECQACGKKGHTVETCFKVNKCDICGKHGHLTSTCYQNPAVKHQDLGTSSGPAPECQI